MQSQASIVLSIVASMAMTNAAVAAADCAANPGAIGTSRTIYVDPAEHPRIGGMQYTESLPLADREVVLTFDDGPLPKHTRPVLDILSGHCVKGTFFIIGAMAREHPDLVRETAAAGHTIGTHSEHHMLTFHRMPTNQAVDEIETGIVSTQAALGDVTLAPFFRIPGLHRTDAVEAHLAERGLMLWSADIPGDDWRHISPAQVVQIVLTRLEAKGKGVILLHDIQARTQAALPTLLAELKARNYRIVHVAPASAEHAKTPTLPYQWQLHPLPENIPVAEWPPVPEFEFITADKLPAPAIDPAEEMSARGPAAAAPWPQRKTADAIAKD